MIEEMRKMAGERRERVKKQSNNENKATSYLRNLSGLHEEYVENAIYIHEGRDIEKFYFALVEQFQEDEKALSIIKDTFSRLKY